MIKDLIKKDYGNVINDLLSGNWQDPVSGKKPRIGIKSIVIRDNLDGDETNLIHLLHPGQRLGVICDSFTYEAAARRITKNLKAGGMNAEALVWEKPRASEEGVEELRQLTKNYEALIAVGAGTVNDSVKYVTFLDNKTFSVFPTSPQNAYTTPTASISFNGFKKSLTTHFPQGVFNDLSIISKCPPRLVKSAFADVICRTTAQVDWLASHLLFNTDYSNIPYTLLAYDELALFANARKLLETDGETFAMLIRICAIMGLGTSFTGSTNSGSMGEHMMSHYIDMFAGEKHPGTLHGEQVGVCTLTVSRLQNQILNSKTPPEIQPTHINEEEIIERYGKNMGKNCIEQLKNKRISPEKAEAINQAWENDWDNFAEPLRKVMLPTQILFQGMEDAGAIKTWEEMKIEKSFYQKVILYSREIRDRFTFLDIAHHSDILEDFSANI